MGLLVTFLVAACVLGASSLNLTEQQIAIINKTTLALDELCMDSFYEAATLFLGTGGPNVVCAINDNIQTLIDPGTGCANALGNTNSIKIVLGLALDCKLTEGCQGSGNIVLNDVGELLKCVLTSKNNVLGSVFTALKNVFVGLTSVKTLLEIVLFILYTLLTKVHDLLCDGYFSLTGLSLALMPSTAIILIGATIGLLQSQALSAVGLLVLLLLPLLLFVVALVVGLLLALALPLDSFVLDMLEERVLAPVIAPLIGNPECSGGSDFSEIISSVKLPPFRDLLQLAFGLAGKDLPQILSQFLSG